MKNFIAFIILASFCSCKENTVHYAFDRDNILELDLLENCNKRIEYYYDIGGKYPSVFQNFDDTSFLENISFEEDLNGVITFSFIVNCEGNPGAFIIHQLDDNFKPKAFSPEVIEVLKRYILELPDFKAFKDFNYYYYLTFKIENGKIKDILP